MAWDLIAEAKKIIGIPSDRGNARLVECLSPLVHQAGLQILIQVPAEGDSGEEEANLIGYSTDKEGDLCPLGLALITHLDTVPPGDKELWTETEQDPYQAKIQEDRIYGLGSADTKLDFLCKLKALEAVGVQNLKIPVALIGTFGEERGLLGAQYLADSGLITPRMALVSEPSELRPVLGHKGMLYLKINARLPLLESIGPVQKRNFKGRAAHGSTPQLGENALLKALEWLEREQLSCPERQLVRIAGGTAHNIVPADALVEVSLGKNPCARIHFLSQFVHQLVDLEERYASLKDARFDPPTSTVNVGVIRSEHHLLEIELAYRLLPEHDPDSILQEWENWAEKFPDTTVEVVRKNAAPLTPEDGPLSLIVAQALRSASLPTTPIYKSGNTEACILQKMGAEVIIIGPGRSIGNIHRPNEFNLVSQLEKAVEFYKAFLEPFC